MSLRILITKPDWGITGGFELVTEELARRLQADGHGVRWVQPKVQLLGDRAYGRFVGVLSKHAIEFVRYVQLVEKFSRLNLERADLVISTMPPSYAIDHPRHLALFSHHLRWYYDLSSAVIEAGFVKDANLHLEAQRWVREIDARYLGAVSQIMATSEEVAGRLDRFNGLRHNVGVCHLGLGFRSSMLERGQNDVFRDVLCVSRHEFPKRTELFVQAAHHVPDTQFVSIGAGSRLGWVKQLDEEFTRGVRDFAGQSRPLWCKAVGWIDPNIVEPGRVRFRGHVSAADLDTAYRRALCVVAPAYLEDYGLTAIEAMAYGKPLIVCDDGGNLTNFVQDGVNGLVVPPDGPGIAVAVRRLADDPGLAARLGAAARELAGAFTWQRTMREFGSAVDEVMSQ